MCASDILIGNILGIVKKKYFVQSEVCSVVCVWARVFIVSILHCHINDPAYTMVRVSVDVCMHCMSILNSFCIRDDKARQYQFMCTYLKLVPKYRSTT